MADIEGGGAADVTIDTGADGSGAPVVIVAGELDISNVGALEARVTSILASEPGRIVFDVAALRFIDSAGIAVLIRTAGKVDTIVLRDPTPPVRRVVELTGLGRLLTIEP